MRRLSRSRTAGRRASSRRTSEPDDRFRGLRPAAPCRPRPDRAQLLHQPQPRHRPRAGYRLPLLRPLARPLARRHSRRRSRTRRRERLAVQHLEQDAAHDRTGRRRRRRTCLDHRSSDPRRLCLPHADRSRSGLRGGVVSWDPASSMSTARRPQRHGSGTATACAGKISSTALPCRCAACSSGTPSPQGRPPAGALARRRQPYPFARRGRQLPAARQSASQMPHLPAREQPREHATAGRGGATGTAPAHAAPDCRGSQTRILAFLAQRACWPIRRRGTATQGEPRRASRGPPWQLLTQRCSARASSTLRDPPFPPDAAPACQRAHPDTAPPSALPCALRSRSQRRDHDNRECALAATERGELDRPDRPRHAA